MRINSKSFTNPPVPRKKKIIPQVIHYAGYNDHCPNAIIAHNKTDSIIPYPKLKDSDKETYEILAQKLEYPVKGANLCIILHNDIGVNLEYLHTFYSYFEVTAKIINDYVENKISMKELTQYGGFKRDVQE